MLDSEPKLKIHKKFTLIQKASHWEAWKHQKEADLTLLNNDLEADSIDRGRHG